MEQTLTFACKLQPSPEQCDKIDALLVAFANACNYANKQVDPKITSKLTIQNQVYRQLREQFGLSANQAVRVCARVGANRKTAKVKNKSVKAFKPTSADYDARIFAFREKDWTVSLTLLGCREHIKLELGNYQKGKLLGRKPTSAQLCKHQDGSYYVHIQLTDIAPEPIKFKSVIGVDLGRRDIAVTSEGDKWDGTQITQVRDRFSRVRASLQKKGTKGAKRLLKRLSGRERRYQTWSNHNISRVIVDKAKSQSATIAIEDLTTIRERTNTQPRNKTERRRSNSWAFLQLRQFLEYKGIQSGIEVIAVNPRYTSQTCHCCLHIHPTKGKSYRSGKKFNCGNCGWIGDADLNGSLMIKILGESVSIPERAALSCLLRQPQVSAKAPCFSAG